MINKHKWGDCSCGCGQTDVPCVKVGKEMFALNCHRRNKAKEQAVKTKEKNAVRSLGSYQQLDGDKKASTSELQRWFEQRAKEMTGTCKHCGGRTTANTSSYKCSVAHILPKAYFKSVATHPLNWIELCFYSNSCHSNFDNYSLDIMELNCFDEVIEKFIAMYPFIDEKEKRRIPDVLLQYVKNNT